MKAAIIAATAFIATAPASADSLTYVNDRFGTVVTFPTELFDTLAEAPENGDGQSFIGENGAMLTIFAAENGRGLDMQAIADAAESDLEEVTLRRVGRNWMAVSGFDQNGRVAYRRSEFGPNSRIHSAIMRYAAEDKGRIDPAVDDIMNSLKQR